MRSLVSQAFSSESSLLQQQQKQHLEWRHQYKPWLLLLDSLVQETEKYYVWGQRRFRFLSVPGSLGRVGLWYVQVKRVSPCYSTILNIVHVGHYGAANASDFALITSLQQPAGTNIWYHGPSQNWEPWYKPDTCSYRPSYTRCRHL